MGGSVCGNRPKRGLGLNGEQRPPLGLSSLALIKMLFRKKKETQKNGLRRIVCKLQSASATDMKTLEAYSQAEAFSVTLVGE